MVPHEWAKPHGDFSRLGLTGAEGHPLRLDPGRRGAGLPGPVEPATEADGESNALADRRLAEHSDPGPPRRAEGRLPREYTDWQKYPLLLLPSPLTSTERNLVHVHTRFWEDARAYVEKGGTLYASLCADAAIPEMADLFGARLADHLPLEEAELTLVAPFGDLAAGTVFHWQGGLGPRHWPALLEVEGGQVIAMDQDGRPALVANTLGKGKTLLCAYPLESGLAVRPGVFEAPEETWRLYRALRQWAGVTPRFETDHPSVEVGALTGPGRGYAVLASHSPEVQTVTVTTSLPVKSIRQPLRRLRTSAS